MSDIFHISMSDYLRRQDYGDYTLEISNERLAELCRVWNLDRSRNILIDLRGADVQFSPIDVRTHVEDILKSGLGRHRQVALIYSPRAGFDAVRFFEFLVTKFDDLQLKVFEDFDEAVSWLSAVKKIEVDIRKKAG